VKRDSFLKVCLSVMAFLAVPFSLIAKGYKNYRDKKGFMVGVGKDRLNKSLSLFEGDTFFCKVSTNDTDGQIYIFESTRVKEGGPPLHYHFDQDEWWYVIQGQFIIKVGDDLFQAKAGDSVFGPRMVPHAFAKVGAEEGKMLITYQPAGKMEDMYNKISDGFTKNMSVAEQDKFREEHGIKRVGPPLANAKNW
jgi:mannose-6-phosphate isomerase-like protein (cupin superfamily)